jgi:hypothetical protein
VAADPFATWGARRGLTPGVWRASGRGRRWRAGEEERDPDAEGAADRGSPSSEASALRPRQRHCVTVLRSVKRTSRVLAGILATSTGCVIAAVTKQRSCGEVESSFT